MKIKGITGTPLVFTEWRGRLDGRRGAVCFSDNRWNSHYIESRIFAYLAFVHKLYTKLEEDTAPLHKESAMLTVEYESLKQELAEPEQSVGGATTSIRLRSAMQHGSVRKTKQSRCAEIPARLAEIEECHRKAVSETAFAQREAAALAERRIHAYLHGASFCIGTVQSSSSAIVPDAKEFEADYLSQHQFNDTARRSLLESFMKEAETV